MIRRSSALHFFLFGLLAALLVGSWIGVQQGERAALEARLDRTAAQAGAHLREFLGRHVDRVRVLAAELAAQGPLDERAFRVATEEYQRRHPGLLALNFVRPDGVIAWVSPEEGNEPAHGRNLLEHPFAAPQVERALVGEGAVEVTPPLELLQGGFGFAAYVRLARDGETLGLLNAVFRLKDLLRGCIPEGADGELAYLLHHGTDLLGVIGPRPNGELPVATADVEVAGRTFTLSVAATPHLVAAEATWVDEALLVLGLALATALALLVHVAHDRQRRALLAAERFRVMIDNAPDAIVAIDVETGRFVNGNRRAYRMLELPRERLDGLDPAELGADPQPDGRTTRDLFGEHVAAAARGEDADFEWILRDGNGRTLRAEVHLVRLPNQGRDIVRASLLDITRRHELEEQLRRTRTHEAMGRLAGGVAHDFNNLLTAILGAGELLLDRNTADPESRTLAQGVIDTCERAAKLTRQLLAFSRHSALRPRPLDLNAVAAGMVPMLERVLPEHVRLSLDLRARSWIVADPSQIELALLNLSINARDAMPKGGSLAIATEDVASGRVALTVKDDGEGIPPAILDRVFEPYFTTKQPDVGSGIGLATVRQIVTQADGEISVESTPEVGTTFRAVFPARGGAIPHVDATPLLPRSRARGHGETVLMVEDDANVRRVVRRALTEAGFAVLAASNAQQARALLREHEAPLALLVTDLVLPDESGLDLAHAVRERNGDLPVLVVSGYSATDVRIDALAGRADLLAKPFRPSDLLDRVHALLAVDAPT